MKKRRQHYVWRYYLEAWAVDDKIYCLRGNNVFNPNPINVANKRDFYRLKELTEGDMSFINKVIEGCPVPLKKLHQNLIDMFGQVFKISRYVNSSGKSNPAFEAAMDIAINNFEEEYHTKIEHSGAKYISMMLDNNLNFCKNDKELIPFLNFIAVQYMRTEKRKANVIKATEHQDVFNVERMWNILSHIFATNIAFDLFTERKKYNTTLLLNETDNPFLTGDQPVINTFGTGTGLKEEVHEIEFYYPLSPKVAVIISRDPKYKKKNYLKIDAESVDAFNRHIILGSHEQIFSCSEEPLTRVMTSRQAGTA